ncbi:MAG: rRNA adenine N-6-methyltransferase family protein, partial [bacterium]
MNSIPAKKSLGQNFLKSKTALNKMIEAGEVTGSDIVLEVGPGKGVLTEKLLLTAKKVIAVEKDDRLISLLQEKFASEIASNKLEIVHDDILNFQQGNYHLKTGEYKIIANI